MKFSFVIEVTVIWTSTYMYMCVCLSVCGVWCETLASMKFV